MDVLELFATQATDFAHWVMTRADSGPDAVRELLGTGGGWHGWHEFHVALESCHLQRR